MSGSHVLCFLLLAAISVPAQNPTASSTPPAEPPTALDWLRRADALTNIRMFGSPAFHMKVTFHAYPGIDFTPKGKSPILTGDGAYEEQWINPKEWRREVTLGTYHAVEVRAGGVRKFQASSDYEPSRVLMLMNALLAPIPRFFLEDKLQENRIHWKVQHLTAGNLPFVRVRYSHTDTAPGGSGEVVRAYDFLPDGILLRSEEDETALTTSWSGGVPFAGKLVPRHISVQGQGLDKEMLLADVTLDPLDPGATVSQITGDPADPGLTLSPIDESDAKVNGPSHFEAPGGSTTSSAYPDNVQIIVIYVVDRHGIAREAEVSGLRVLGQPLSSAQSEAVTRMAIQMVDAAGKNRFPMTLDNAPCELRMTVIMLDLR